MRVPLGAKPFEAKCSHVRMAGRCQVEAIPISAILKAVPRIGSLRLSRWLLRRCVLRGPHEDVRACNLEQRAGPRRRLAGKGAAPACAHWRWARVPIRTYDRVVVGRLIRTRKGYAEPGPRSGVPTATLSDLGKSLSGRSNARPALVRALARTALFRAGLAV